MTLQPHPLALIPPPLTKEQEEALEESLLKNGQIRDIVTHEGMILDGNHKYKLLLKNGIKPRMVEFKPNGCATPKDFVIAMMQGRQIKPSQVAAVAALFHQQVKKYPLENLSYKPDLRSLKNKGLSKEEKTRAKYLSRTYVKIAKEFGVGSVSVSKAISLLNAGESGKPYFDLVYSGKLPVETAYNKFRKETGSKMKRAPYTGTPWHPETLTNLVKIPNCFDAREEIDKFIRVMNKSGWILEMKFKDEKIFANWYGNGFPPNSQWKDYDGEFEFRRAVVVAANSKRNNILKIQNKNEKHAQ